jgi:hypothetical protein
MQKMESSPINGESNEPCAYCGARPTWPVLWTYDDGMKYTLYLCAECDDEETDSLEDVGV